MGANVCRMPWLLVLVLLTSSCTTVIVPYRGLAPNARRHIDNFPFFAYEPVKSGVLLEELPAVGDYPYQKFHLELLAPEKRIEATYYRSTVAGKRGLIIILPLYGKHELPAVFVTASLLIGNPYRDFNILYLKEHEGDDPLDLDGFVSVSTEEDMFSALRDSRVRFRRAVVGIRRLIDWAENEPDIDARRIGLVGLSTSALVVSVAMGVDERIAAGVVFMGGGNLYEMFAYAEEPRIKMIRENVMRDSGKTADELRDLFKPFFWGIEPVRYAANIDPSRVLFMDAKFDEYIPESGREAFWHAAGKPERITYFHGHHTSFLSTTILDLGYAPRKMVEFFRKTLK